MRCKMWFPHHHLLLLLVSSTESVCSLYFELFSWSCVLSMFSFESLPVAEREYFVRSSSCLRSKSDPPSKNIDVSDPVANRLWFPVVLVLKCWKQRLVQLVPTVQPMSVLFTYNPHWQLLQSNGSHEHVPTHFWVAVFSSCPEAQDTGTGGGQQNTIMLAHIHARAIVNMITNTKYRYLFSKSSILNQRYKTTGGRHMRIMRTASGKYCWLLIPWTITTIIVSITKAKTPSPTM